MRRSYLCVYKGLLYLCKRQRERKKWSAPNQVIFIYMTMKAQMGGNKIIIIINNNNNNNTSYPLPSSIHRNENSYVTHVFWDLLLLEQKSIFKITRKNHTFQFLLVLLLSFWALVFLLMLKSINQLHWFLWHMTWSQKAKYTGHFIWGFHSFVTLAECKLSYVNMQFTSL